MYTDNSYIFEKDLKAKLLEVFRFSIDFLNRHNLKWFVGQGTCIGAVRHNGLIPWDDDIDLLMPREDYNKLLSLQPEFDGTNYELMSWYQGHFPSPFTKIVDRNTTLWELKFQPFITGVFIDIFPMDLTDETPQRIEKKLGEYDKYLNLYWSSISDFSLKDSVELLKQKRLRYFGHSVLSLITHTRKNYYLNKLQSLDKEHNNIDGAYYVLYSSCFAYKYEKEIFKREWFDDHVLMPFEGFEVRVPIGYNAYLTHVYGDYMQLPPEEKRVTRHYHYYFNLKERKTIEEIKEIKCKEHDKKPK